MNSVSCITAIFFPTQDLAPRANGNEADAFKLFNDILLLSCLSHLYGRKLCALVKLFSSRPDEKIDATTGV